MTLHRAAIGLGSNLGDSRSTLESALRELDSHGVSVVRASSFIETAPVGGPPQDDFLNAAAVVETGLDPLELLGVLLEIEAKHGRERRVINGPRTLDLDLLLFDDLVLDSVNLVLPHPRMHERAFVLGPLAEIAPDWMHPVLGRSIGSLLADLGRVP